jgi:hypothetical protein
MLLSFHEISTSNSNSKVLGNVLHTHDTSSLYFNYLYYILYIVVYGISLQLKVQLRLSTNTDNNIKYNIGLCSPGIEIEQI